MRTVTTDFSENFDRWGWEVQDVRDAGDRVVALVEMTGQIKNSGSPISRPMGLVVSKFRDATFGEVRAYPSWQEALTAVGMEQ
jgi:hypothetical protein